MRYQLGDQHARCVEYIGALTCESVFQVDTIYRTIVERFDLHTKRFRVTKDQRKEIISLSCMAFTHRGKLVSFLRKQNWVSSLLDDASSGVGRFNGRTASTWIEAVNDSHLAMLGQLRLTNPLSCDIWNPLDSGIEQPNNLWSFIDSRIQFDAYLAESVNGGAIRELNWEELEEAWFNIRNEVKAATGRAPAYLRPLASGGRRVISFATDGVTTIEPDMPTLPTPSPKQTTSDQWSIPRSPSEWAKIFDCSVDALKRRHKQGKFPRDVVNAKLWRLPSAFLEKHSIDP